MSLERTLRRAAERKDQKLARKAEKANQTNEKNNNNMINNNNPPQPEPPQQQQQQEQPNSEPQTNNEAPSSPISAARLAANRANAKHSTGPTSPSGLAASSQNRTSHGLARHTNGEFQLLECEDQSQFIALSQALEQEHQPVTETEIVLVRTMAESQWLTERAHRLQHTCLDPAVGTVKDPKMFTLYMRYQTTHKRAFHKSLNDLQKLRCGIRKAELGFEAQKIKTEQHKMKSELHEVDLRAKKVAADFEIGKLTAYQIKADLRNPIFEARFKAEKAQRAAAA